MKKFLLLASLFWVSLLSHGQVTGKITNQVSGQPVAYANIWVENENLGTTSNEKGQFFLNGAALTGKTLVVSCLGYERRQVQVTEGPIAITLKPISVALQEVTVRKNAQRQKTILNALDEDTQYSFGSGGTPWIVAQYFPYKPTFDRTPFLEEVALVTLSNLKNAKFHVRLLAADEKGEPGRDILPKPLLVSAPKGIKTVHVKLSDYDVQMPANGIFVAFEWLIIPGNRYQSVDEETGVIIAQGPVSYEPSLRTRRPSSQIRHGWIYDRGQWRSTDNAQEAEGIRYAIPHFQLTLSN